MKRRALAPPRKTVLLVVSIVFLTSAAIGFRQTIVVRASQKVTTTKVNIDMVPEDPSNKIDLGSNSLFAVAILSSTAFDATLVDPATVQLAGTLLTKSEQEKVDYYLRDVNSDGLQDLVVYLSTMYLQQGAEQVNLRAATFSGVIVQGSDFLQVIGEVPKVTPKQAAASTGLPASCNSTSITIPASGAATPYPSDITVAGLTGVITKVTVDLFGLSHTFPDDIDILLVSPSGKAVVLMSDVGGGTDITNVNLTIDDAASQFFSDAGTIVSGTFRPTNQESDSFPAGAPVPTAANPFGGTLAFFNGTNPNGTWSLYVADDASGDTGQISGGWCLNITTAASSTTCPPTLVTSSLAPGDPTLPGGRPFRNGFASNCITPKTCSLTPPSTGTFRFKTFNFTNQSASTACVTVSVTANQPGCPAQTFASAFLGSVDTANFCTNYLGDAGQSPTGTNLVPPAFSFSVPAGATFVVLVNETVSANPTGCGSFSVLVEGEICAPATGTCVLTCPPSVTVPNTPDQCGANVSYPLPTPTGNCGTVTCVPPSGTFFSVGTTTVNCIGVSCDSAFATTTTNQLVAFNTATPGTATTTAITGLVSGDQVVGIDFRPVSGELYALGVNGSIAHLYIVNKTTAVATQIGGNIVLPQSAGVTAGTEYGFDFNPTVDRIRVVANSRDNFRLNPSTGAVSGADTALTAGANVVGAAYDRNFAGAIQSTLFGIDSLTDMLVLIGGINGVPSPNTGAVTNVGSLGVNTSDLVGFDITSCGAALAALNVGGTSQLYSINLSNGAATLIGAIGSALQIRSLAIGGVTGSCSFTVTVLDTQPPTISCPADIIAVTDQSICSLPGTTVCQVVTFPPPTVGDNCPGVTFACMPPSGTCLDPGVTTVTCTATDASGNMASCSFTISVFDVALQDDSNPNITLLWNSLTGEYRFCCNGTVFTGFGIPLRKGCIFTLDHTGGPDRRVLGRVDKAVHTGSASLQFPPGTILCTITDRNTLNDTNLTSCQ